MNILIEPLSRTLESHHAGFDSTELQRAFEIAERAHLGQTRKSGEPYITHPVAVAEILAHLGLNSATIIAALLHDTVEDTYFSLDSVKKEFGNEVAALVDGVTKLDRLTYGPNAESETLRKMVVAMSKDIRVLVIKLADRLHNARTWQFVDSEKASKKARETLDIYAPLANRLGIGSIHGNIHFLNPDRHRSRDDVKG